MRCEVVQTFGDSVNFPPHVHAIATRGGWTATGEWVGVAYVDEQAAERLFQYKAAHAFRRAHDSASGEEPPLVSADLAARKRRWADLTRRIYEVDPPLCSCGGAMKIIPRRRGAKSEVDPDFWTSG